MPLLLFQQDSLSLSNARSSFKSALKDITGFVTCKIVLLNLFKGQFVLCFSLKCPFESL
ncbi:hypothetical protein HMPREF3213_01587 [Heyndrickxia coagulans]|uniref:Uncharacterized protein n=1 Tax=Heyndrickxia coagulans TaxID=1398 RepID=A0A150JNM7_HEYCO|nr:hypothetical protein HMPREF3213_01587 [Heyndrickxia coagulans]KYC58691.1 hypothetical protein B4100_2611 [Heyndrickxia coagulans]